MIHGREMRQKEVRLKTEHTHSLQIGDIREEETLRRLKIQSLECTLLMVQCHICINATYPILRRMLNETNHQQLHY
jgi:hypothetical protein